MAEMPSAMDVTPENAQSWISVLERITESRFAVLVVLLLVVIYLIYRARRQDNTVALKDQELAKRNEVIVELTRETTTAMAESTAVISKLADTMKGARS